MATLKTAIPRTSPLPILNTSRAMTPMKSTYAAMNPILPDIISMASTEKRRSTKRVHFAAKLESVQEASPPLTESNTCATLSATIKGRVIDPWREDGPLYGSYVEYLEKKGTLASNIKESDEDTQSSQKLLPQTERKSSAYTHTFAFKNKPLENLKKSISFSLPPLNMPAFPKRVTTPLKTTRISNDNLNTKETLPMVDNNMRRRLQPTTPHSSIITRGKSASYNPKFVMPPKYPNEKFNQTDMLFNTKLPSTYTQAKKLIEIIAEPLPGKNNEINRLTSENIALDALAKTPYTSSEAFFTQVPTNDHCHPIIYSKKL